MSAPSPLFSSGYHCSNFSLSTAGVRVCSIRCPPDFDHLQWVLDTDAGRPFVRVRSSDNDFGFCASRSSRTRAKRPRARRFGFLPRQSYEAQWAAQAWYSSNEGRRQHARRAGVEGTVSQGVRAFGRRRSRYRGLAKTHLQNVAVASAINLDRLVAWLDGWPRSPDPCFAPDDAGSSLRNGAGIDGCSRVRQQYPTGFVVPLKLVRSRYDTNGAIRKGLERDRVWTWAKGKRYGH